MNVFIKLPEKLWRARRGLLRAATLHPSPRIFSPRAPSGSRFQTVCCLFPPLATPPVGRLNAAQAHHFDVREEGNQEPLRQTVLRRGGPLYTAGYEYVFFFFPPLPNFSIRACQQRCCALWSVARLPK